MARRRPSGRPLLAPAAERTRSRLPSIASWALVAGATALVLSAAAVQASRASVSLHVSASLLEQFMPRTASRY